MNAVSRDGLALDAGIKGVIPGTTRQSKTPCEMGRQTTYRSAALSDANFKYLSMTMTSNSIAAALVVLSFVAGCTTAPSPPPPPASPSAGRASGSVSPSGGAPTSPGATAQGPTTQGAAPGQQPPGQGTAAAGPRPYAVVIPANAVTGP